MNTGEKAIQDTPKEPLEDRQVVESRRGRASDDRRNVVQSGCSVLLILFALGMLVLVCCRVQMFDTDTWAREPVPDCILGACSEDSPAAIQSTGAVSARRAAYHRFSLIFGLFSLLLIVILPPFRGRRITRRLWFALTSFAWVFLAWMSAQAIATLFEVTLDYGELPWFLHGVLQQGVFLEEWIKASGALVVFALLPRAGRSPTTLIFCGVVTGLAFAGFENLNRIAEQIASSCPERVLFNRLPTNVDHAIYSATAVSGIAVWMFHGRRRRFLWLVVLMFAVAVVMHWLHNNHWMLWYSFGVCGPDHRRLDVWRLLPSGTLMACSIAVCAAVPWYLYRSVRASGVGRSRSLLRGSVLGGCLLAYGLVNLGMNELRSRGLSDRMEYDYRDKEEDLQAIAAPPTGTARPARFVALRDTAAPMAFVSLSGGSFTMGSALGTGSYIEHPRHRVTLSPFRMAVTEVTRYQYAWVMEMTLPDSAGDGSLPADYVSWCDAVRFANVMSELEEGLEPVYEITDSDRGWEGCVVTWEVDRRGFRLPTESEWEYVARDMGQRGDDPTAEELEQVAWFEDNASGRPHPVASLAPSALGIHDVYGNVDEWAWDWFSTYPSSPTRDPRGPASSLQPGRIVRGGNMQDPVEELQPSRRRRSSPMNRTRFQGLRLCLSGSE